MRIRNSGSLIFAIYLFYNGPMSAEKFTMKVIGKCRVDTDDSIEESRVLQRTINRLRKVGLVPKGLYRFKSHEEAHKWMIEKMASSHVRLKSKT